MITPGQPHITRWPQRRVASWFVRAVIILIPLAAGFVIAVLVGRSLGKPQGVPSSVLWWAAVLGASVVAVAVVDAQARRLLPLATLLRLSLIFPDQAPSRFRVALRAGSVRNLQERARNVPQGEEPALAAQRILILTGALARHDAATRGHSERVRAYTDLLAEELGLSEEDTDRLRWSALLHDVGKLTVSHDILNKRGELETAEWEDLRRHPTEGARIAEPLQKWLGPWALAIAQHHERWDGNGYPRGLAGTKISHGARIVAVADAFDVMTATRSYKPAMRPDAARAELARCAEIDFDPRVVRAFLDLSLGRIRWILGIGAVLAVPAVPKDVTRTARTALTGGLAAVVALSVGALPVNSTGGVQVLGERFERPALSVAPPDVAEPPTSEAQQPTLPEPSSPAVASASPTVPTAQPTAPPVIATITGTPPGPAAALQGVAPSLPGTPVQPTTSTTSTTSTMLPPAPRVAVDDVAAIRVDHPTHIDVLANDQALPGTTLRPKTVRIVAGPLHGKAHVDGDGRVHYQPAKHYRGPDAFTYAVCDDSGACFTAVVILTVA